MRHVSALIFTAMALLGVGPMAHAQVGGVPLALEGLFLAEKRHNRRQRLLLQLLHLVESWVKGRCILKAVSCYYGLSITTSN